MKKTLKQLRKQKGWNQSEIARRLDMSVPAYSKIESGFTDVNLSRLVQIAEVHGISTIELFGGSSTPSEGQKESLSAVYDTFFARGLELYDLQKKQIELTEQINSIKARA